MEEVASDSGLARTGETTWAFGTLEESATLTRAGHRVTVFPALVDEGATVGLGVFGSTDEAEARHRLGVRRLLLLALDAPVGRGAARRPRRPRERLGLAGLAVRRASRSCSRTAAPPWSAGLVDARAAGAVARPAYDALLATARATAPSRRCGTCSAERAAGARRLARPPTRRSAGAPRWRCCRRWPT